MKYWDHVITKELTFNQAKAYKEEGISKDLMIYLLEQYKKEILGIK